MKRVSVFEWINLAKKGKVRDDFVDDFPENEKLLERGEMYNYR